MVRRDIPLQESVKVVRLTEINICTYIYEKYVWTQYNYVKSFKHIFYLFDLFKYMYNLFFMKLTRFRMVVMWHNVNVITEMWKNPRMFCDVHMTLLPILGYVILFIPFKSNRWEFCLSFYTPRSDSIYTSWLAQPRVIFWKSSKI